jgi:hypothetical protein
VNKLIAKSSEATAVPCNTARTNLGALAVRKGSPEEVEWRARRIPEIYPPLTSGEALFEVRNAATADVPRELGWPTRGDAIHNTNEPSASASSQRHRPKRDSVNLPKVCLLSTQTADDEFSEAGDAL